MKRDLFRKGASILLLTVVLLTGCAQKWSLRTEQSGADLQWPFPPAKAKLTFLRSLTGFNSEGLAKSVLNTVVYGSSRSEEDAFGVPVAVAVGADGRIAVADTGRKCVHLYLPESRRYIRLSGHEGNKIESPVAVVFDDRLRLYVSDSAGRKVLVFGNGGEFLSSLVSSGPTSLERPTGLAYNSHRKLLYVVDTLQHKVFAYNEKGDVAFSFGKRGEENGSFNFPTHIFWSPAGMLYITDTLNFRIEIFDESGGFLSSFGRHGDSYGDIAMPKGVAADEDGTIYVADSVFDSVQLFDREGKFLLSVGRSGKDPGDFWMPSGIFIDQDGILYVCDAYNHRIQLFRLKGRYVYGKA